ncbi:MAG: hypothetical protein OIN90_12035 [Candidatus Methanoperedens sp.]|nr:hypothetical protein [Candidatus Methanoperedens sp.]
MRYSIGDIVKFKVGTDDIQEGEVQIIEKSLNEDILYINSFGGWAYKVTEKRIISMVPVKKSSKPQRS